VNPNLVITPVPEPGSWLLLGSGVSILAFGIFWKMRRAEFVPVRCGQLRL